MAFFRKRRYMWNEPWFFQQRIRTVGSWLKISIFLFGIAGFVGAAIWLTGKPANPPELWELIGLPIGLAAAIWWVLDGTETRRTAVLDEKELIVGGDMGKYSQPTVYQLSEIDAAAIVMPDESKWHGPALFFIYQGEEQAIGIDRQVDHKRLAQAIHDVGIPIRLDGWEPGQENGFEKTFHWQASPNVIKPSATVTVLFGGETGLFNVVGITWAIFLQCWALGLWLLLTSAIGYYTYLHWNQLGAGQMAAAFVVPLASLMAAAQYTDRFATAATSMSLIRGAINQIAKRSQPLIDPNSGALIPVEVFQRDQFDKTIQKVREMGFIQVDSQRQRVLFEGKKEKWVLLSDSIESLAIEEVQTGTAGQSAMGMLNYYVTLSFSTPNGSIEYGLRHSERDYGEVTDVKRAAGSLQVFEAIESVLPPGVSVDQS